VREAAIDALKTLGNPDAIPPLVAVAKSGPLNVRWRAAQALKALAWQPKSESENTAFIVALGDLERAALLGKVAVGPMSELVTQVDCPKRMLAVDLLGEIGDPSAVPALLTALADKDGMLRRAAANALGHIGSPETISPLVNALKDIDANVRATAASALGELGDSQTVEALVSALQDANWEVRVAVLEALGRLKDARALESMLACLNDADKEVRHQAAEALGELGHPTSVGALVLAMIDPDHGMRQAAARALTKVDPRWEQTAAAQEAVPTIRAALQAKDSAIQFAAGETLRRLEQAASVTPAPPSPAPTPAAPKPHSAVAALLELLKDRDPNVRRAAVESLGQMGEASLLGPLRAALSDEDATVRAAVAKALGSLR
jgi:HEAT repeat protein